VSRFLRARPHNDSSGPFYVVCASCANDSNDLVCRMLKCGQISRGPLHSFHLAWLVTDFTTCAMIAIDVLLSTVRPRSLHGSNVLSSSFKRDDSIKACTGVFTIGITMSKGISELQHTLAASRSKDTTAITVQC